MALFLSWCFSWIRLVCHLRTLFTHRYGSCFALKLFAFSLSLSQRRSFQRHFSLVRFVVPVDNEMVD